MHQGLGNKAIDDKFKLVGFENCVLRIIEVVTLSFGQLTKMMDDMLSNLDSITSVGTIEKKETEKAVDIK